MRDDIHKLVRAPAQWRSLVRACTNDADWLEEGTYRAERALVAEVRREIGAEFVRDLGAMSGASQMELFKPERLEDMVRHRQLRPLEDLVVNELRRIGESQPSETDPVPLAVARALTARSNAFVRNVRGSLALANEPGSEKIMHRLRVCLAAADPRRIGASLACGVFPRFPIRNRSLDVDADLLGRR